MVSLTDAVEVEAERRRAQLERLSAIGSLVAGLAHEIRTPLTAAYNHLELARSRLNRAASESQLPDTLQDAPGHIAAALDQLERIDRLVEGLRGYAGGEGGHRARVSLHHVVEDALQLVRSANRGRVVVLADLQPTPRVDVDQAQLQEAALRLVESAAEVAPTGATVRVATRATMMAAEIVVTVGATLAAPPEQDLAPVRRVVEEHGGALLVRFEPEQGLLLAASLPLRRKRAATQG